MRWQIFIILKLRDQTIVETDQIYLTEAFDVPIMERRRFGAAEHDDLREARDSWKKLCRIRAKSVRPVIKLAVISLTKASSGVTAYSYGVSRWPNYRARARLSIV